MTTNTDTPRPVSVSEIMAFESGELSAVDTVNLFSSLVLTGMAWSLQGFYGRTAANLIEQGILSDTGEILVDVEAL